MVFRIEEFIKKLNIFLDFKGKNITKILVTVTIKTLKNVFIITITPHKGIIFWIVDINKILIQLILGATENIQLWKGIIPILIKNDKLTNSISKLK